MKKIKLMTEFIHGPVWVYDEKGLPDSLDIVEEDSIIQKIDSETADLYTSYYEFDSHDQTCWFNKEQSFFWFFVSCNSCSCCRRTYL
jgi:hypothetical protein